MSTMPSGASCGTSMTPAMSSAAKTIADTTPRSIRSSERMCRSTLGVCTLS